MELLGLSYKILTKSEKKEIFDMEFTHDNWKKNQRYYILFGEMYKKLSKKNGFLFEIQHICNKYSIGLWMRINIKYFSLVYSRFFHFRKRHILL